MISLGQRSALLSHGFSFQVELIGAVHEPVEDGIGQGGISDDGVPFRDRELTGDDARAHRGTPARDTLARLRQLTMCFGDFRR